MRILEVPLSLRSPGHDYPQHNVGDGQEGYFDSYAHLHASELDTDWIYLPIRWTNNYVVNRVRTSSPDLFPMPEHQKILDSLLPNERYFTIAQCDDGIYEQIPRNLLVFGCGGRGDVPLPLLSSPHALRLGGHRSAFACFAGNTNCGGPTSDSPTNSKGDRNGIGSLIRKSMMQEFKTRPNCAMHVPSNLSTHRYCNLMASSKFALCPRGYGKTSFRLYEAMELGCVPVYITDMKWLPYADVINWNDLAVIWETPGNCSDLYESLTEVLSNTVDRKLRTAQSLYKDYFTMDGFSKQIFRMIMERT